MQTINLIPREYVKTEQTRRRSAISIAVLVSVVLMMGGVFKLITKQIDRQTRTNASLERELGDVENEKAQMTEQTCQLALLLQRKAAARQLNQDRRCTLILARVSDAVSDNLFLTRVRFVNAAPEEPTPATPGTAPRSPKPPEAKQPAKPEARKITLFIEGYALAATDVTGFITRFGGPDLFEQVIFKTAQAGQINNLPLTHFELECPIRSTTPEAKAPPTSLAQAAGGVQ